MAKSVSLPFCVPVFAHTQGIASVGLVISNHPTAYNQILNQAVSPCCSRKFLRGFTTPQVYIADFSLKKLSCIETYDVNLKFVHQYFHELVKRMMDEGYYVYYTGADDFFLPGKSWYGIRHMPHDGVLCGYDDEKRTYSIAAYDINWIYNLIEVSQDAMMQAFEASMQQNIYGNLVAAKVKDISVDLDEHMILKNIKAYLDWTVEKYSLEEDGWVKGIAVHDFLSMYLGKLLDGSIPYEKMDWRIMRLIWEHKKCMLDRIVAVEQKQGWNDEISSAYQAIVEEANSIRMMYALYHRKRRDSILQNIQKRLAALKERESEILQTFIQCLEKKRNV